MSKGKAVRARKRNLGPRSSRTTRHAALVKLLRPIVRDLMAEELDRREDEGDVRDSREAMAEGGAIPNEEFWKKYGLQIP